jgi:hypothetical protein
MAEQNHNTIFGDQGTEPERKETPDQKAKRSDGNVKVNDEDREPGKLRGDRPDRPSTANDQSNPRTGPIG